MKEKAKTNSKKIKAVKPKLKNVKSNIRTLAEIRKKKDFFGECLKEINEKLNDKSQILNPSQIIKMRSFYDQFYSGYGVLRWVLKDDEKIDSKNPSDVVNRLLED